MRGAFALLASAILAAQLAHAASVSGVFTVADSRDPAVRKSKNYSGIVVWLEPVTGKPPAASPRAFTVLQKGKRFTPHVTAIPVGSTVEFPNLDPIFHNAFSNFSGQPFDTGLYPPGTSQKIRFTRGGIVRVFCNIHSSMSAVIVVLNTPWYATTAQNGSFQIDNVPPGEYRLQVWHERAPEGTLNKLERRVVLTSAPVTLPPAIISESGYVEVPHKNKFGAEYPAEPADGVKYSTPSK